jgi:hypothetical protein
LCLRTVSDCVVFVSTVLTVTPNGLELPGH